MMTKNQIKIILLLTIVFVLANGAVYYLTQLNEKQRIKIALDDHINNLETHYEIILHNQKVLADAAYRDTTKLTEDFIEIFKELQTASSSQKAILRTQLYNLLKNKYSLLKEQGVLQYQFLLPDNESFLRMHKPSKYGDNLTEIRNDFKYTNDTHKPIRGLAQGRIAHGFRNIYPIFDDQSNYLGAMEISFSSDSIQEYLTNISKIHTHFIVNKQIFDAKTWERDDLILKYEPSSEHKDFMLTMNAQHTKEKCILENKEKLKNVRGEIEQGMKKGKKFAVYTIHEHSLNYKHHHEHLNDKETHKHIDVISFFPIKDLSNTKTLAWIVSYEQSDFIHNTIQGNFIIRTILFLIFLILGYFVFKTLNQKELLSKLVKEKTLELENINENLEQKIIKEVEKSKDIENKLFQSEKLASMGEMIGNIAHQWRQPLSAISTISTAMKVESELGLLNNKDINKKCDTINNNAQYLSDTINDFRNFIEGNREKTIFKLKDGIKTSLHLIECAVNNCHINIVMDQQDDLEIYGYENELSQCLINILNNAKDALMENEEDNRYIFISTSIQNNNAIIKIKDNAGGIPDDVLPKVFEPYFTTKHKSQGTGLGLHMTYTLITDGMDGSIEAENVNYGYDGKNFTGALLSISLPL